MDNHKIIGSFELVGFPDYQMEGIVAKIDTGAFTGSLHCTKIEEGYSDGHKTLTFSPFDHPEIIIATTEYASRKVKSSNGKSQMRYFIKTTITIQKQPYQIELSLADRSEMKWPVLVGRRFLHKNDFLVDINHANDIVTK